MNAVLSRAERHGADHLTAPSQGMKLDAMKASKIITLGLVAASTGLIMGTVALPAQAASGDRVVNAQLTDRPDSGEDGNDRALNDLHRQIKITESAPRVYDVTVRDNGMFSDRGRLGQIKITESAPGVYDVTVRDNGMFSDRDHLGRRWLSLLGQPNLGAAASRNCTPGYSPCLPPAVDYDCRGNGGNGPKYVDGPVRVKGSDPYDLDRDGNGVGCQ